MLPKALFVTLFSCCPVALCYLSTLLLTRPNINHSYQQAFHPSFSTRKRKSDILNVRRDSQMNALSGDLASTSAIIDMHSPLRLFNEELIEQNKIGVKKMVVWNLIQQKFITSSISTISDKSVITLINPQQSLASSSSSSSSTSSVQASSFPSKLIATSNRNILSIKHFLHNCFIPSGDLSNDYYTYTYWRLLQRFISATNSVFGTQALLLALGFKKNQIGVAAATTWVLKDALGKISRILWASENGRKFDTDAKRWRFRSSVLFAIGNALEILTYMTPSLFLISAAVANGLKQMAMLTSSSTRNAIYKSFSRTADNIGDITAKGEAQLAVVDLLGMFAGILCSKAVNAAKGKIAILFVALSSFDLYCIFREVQSVVFNKLNFQRSYMVLRDIQNKYYDSQIQPIVQAHTFIHSDSVLVANSGSSSASSSTINSGNNINGLNGVADVSTNIATAGLTTAHPPITTTTSTSPPSSSTTTTTTHSLSAITSSDTSSAAYYYSDISPDKIAKEEKIFQSSRLGEEIFKTWTTLDVRVNVLQQCLNLYLGSSSSGSKSSNTNSNSGNNISISVKSGNNVNNMIVLLQMKKLSTIEAKIPLLRFLRFQFYDHSSIIRKVAVPSSSGKLTYDSYVFTPQILLKQSATHYDIFRSLIIVNRMLHLIEKSTLPMNSKITNNKTNSNNKISNNNNSQAHITSSSTSAFEDVYIMQVSQEAYVFEQTQRDNIMNILQTAGWDLSRYMYGDVRVRNEWV